MLASLLPDWNSIEAVGRWQNRFTILGYIALGLLLLFEVLAHIYSNRKDTLVAAHEATAERVRQETAARHDSELAQANAQIRALEKGAAPRTIGLKEQHDILHALIPYAGHPVFITKLGDQEAAAYADQIISLFSGASWKVNETLVGIMSPPTYGMQCTIAREPDAAVKAMLSAFEKAGVPLDIRHAGAPDTLLSVTVGLKPVTGSATHR